MARPSIALVTALRSTVERLLSGAAYQWGHHGQCNCGHLAQTLLGIVPARIHSLALERDGDWEALCNAYCPTSGYAIDDVITELVASGLTTQDLAHLERLDDETVLAALPGGKRWLRRNDRADLVAYLTAWATLLEAALPIAPARAA
jgi:hypothetical protein